MNPITGERAAENILPPFFAPVLDMNLHVGYTRDMKNNTYNLRITRPAPSMWQDTVVFEADSYQAAVARAHETYRETGRNVCLGTGECGMYAWHIVDGKGVATDRNFNSGVPETQLVSR